MTPFNGLEEQLPQRLQVPALLRRSVGDNVNLREMIPINGTTLFGVARPISQKRRDTYHRRKVQEKEARARARARLYQREEAMGSWERRTDGRIAPLSDVTSEASISTLPVHEEGTYHRWDINDPSTTATLVDHHGRTTRPHTAVNHNAAAALLLSPSGGPEQLRTSAPDSGDPVYLHFPYTASAASSPLQKTSYAADIVYATHVSSTTLNLETSNGSFSFSTYPSESSPPPTVPTQDRGESVPPPSALTPPSKLEPAPSAAQGSWWCNDRFFAVYQDFFIRRASHDGVSSSPSPTSTPVEYSLVPLELANDRPTAQAYPSTASVSSNNSVYYDIAELYPLEGSRTSGSEYATQSEGSGYIDWSIPSMIFEPIDPQRLAELEAAAMAGYADTLRLQASLLSAVPEEAYTAMHQSLLATQTSCPKLKGALELPHCAYITDSAPLTLAAARCPGSSRRDSAWAHTVRQDWHGAPASSL